MGSLTSTIVLIPGQDAIGIDKYRKLSYYTYMTRTYMMYAGLTFLGYEYGATEQEVLFRTRAKFGEPSKWNETEYTANLIRWPEEETA